MNNPPLTGFAAVSVSGQQKICVSGCVWGGGGEGCVWGVCVCVWEGGDVGVCGVRGGVCVGGVLRPLGLQS